MQCKPILADSFFRGARLCARRKNTPHRDFNILREKELCHQSVFSPDRVLLTKHSAASRYLLDQRGRLLQEIMPSTAAYNYQINAAGDTTLSIDPLGRVSRNQYSAAEDLTQVTRADGSIWSYQSNATFHEVTQATDALGNITLSVYDPASGHLTSSSDALGNQTSYV